MDLGQQVICVDDGSTDGRAEIIQRTPARLLLHVFNLGQGAVLRTGLRYVIDNTNVERVATFDADGQHETKDVGALVRPVLGGPADVVFATRFLSNESNTPLLKRIVLLLSCAFIPAFAAFLGLKGAQYRAIRTLIGLVFLVLVVVSIVFPRPWQNLADLVGVSRGADLLVYVTFVALFTFPIATARKIRELGRSIAISVMEASLDPKRSDTRPTYSDE